MFIDSTLGIVHIGMSFQWIYYKKIKENKKKICKMLKIKQKKNTKVFINLM